MRYRKGLQLLSLLCISATVVGIGAYFVSNWTVFRPLVEPDDDGKIIVTKYLKALGGDDEKLILRTGYIKYIAKVGFESIKDSESLVEDTFDFPARFKRVVRVTDPIQEFKMIFVTSDGKGWKKLDNMDPEPVKVFKTGWMGEKEHDLATLWNWGPALGENVRLTRDGEERVGKQTAAVVHVSGEDGVETDLYFDKRTALLIKSKKFIPGDAMAKIWATMPGPPSEPKEADADKGSDKLIAMEVFLENYQNVQGRMVPMKIRAYQDGKPLLDFTLKEVKFLEKIDAGEFALP